MPDLKELRGHVLMAVKGEQAALSFCPLYAMILSRPELPSEKFHDRWRLKLPSDVYQVVKFDLDGNATQLQSRDVSAIVSEGRPGSNVN
jgi:hypothetical protein